jgi:serine/threonine protein kinase
MADFTGNDRFRILRRLGAGGMGVVFQAFDQQDNRVVALKTLRNVDPTGIYRIKREFRTLADVVNRNLVTLYELFSSEDQWFFTMEFVAGREFLSYVLGTSHESTHPTRTAGDSETRPPPSPRLDSRRPDSAAADGMADTRAASAGSPIGSPGAPPRPVSSPPCSLSASQLERLRAALRQVVHGLGALHRTGTLHRDIKPSNVMVTHDGRVVILDFGLAVEIERTDSSITAQHTVVGTVAYMSPEQAAALPLSTASDWYSVGVMVYEALTGQLPWAGLPWQMLIAKRQTDPPAPRELAPDAPNDLSALCVRLLSRDPGARPGGEEILRILGPEPMESEVFRPRPSTLAARRPFVGRQEPLRVLMDAFQAVRAGRCVVVCVAGKSGVGKTALVQQFLDAIRPAGDVVVLSGRCHERESVPYKGMDGLVDTLSQYIGALPAAEVDALMPRDAFALARVFPVLRRVGGFAQPRRPTADIPDEQELRQRAFAALREVLTRLGDRRALVLHIDDLQWSDLDSGVLLGDVLRPPDPPVLLLVVCHRSEGPGASPVLDAIDRLDGPGPSDCGFRRLTLEPLTGAEARQLALALLGADDEESRAAADSIALEAAGHPYFVGELAQRHLTLADPGADALEGRRPVPVGQGNQGTGRRPQPPRSGRRSWTSTSPGGCHLSG